MDLVTKQIVALNERRSVVQLKTTKTGKYRQGTLWVLSTFRGILFTVIIFKAGPIVAKQLKEDYGHGNVDTDVYFYCSPSGSMTLKIWEQVMVILQSRTKEMRLCQNMNGEDWKNAIVLNIDNYSVHLNAEIAHRYATRYGIFIRCLLRNASHIQQPIDHHVGQLMKRIIKQKIESWVSKSYRIASLDTCLQVTDPKWRQMVIAFVIQAVRELKDEKYLDVFVAAWINYGLYLMLDGSDDEKIETLHDDKPKLVLQVKHYINCY